jgi:hypothetical protein
MTSSFLLKKRKEMGDVWNIANFSNPSQDSLGGWEDHYIINGACRECGPGFEAVPIGNPYGFMICRRRTDYKGKSFDLPQDIDYSQFNGYHKFSADLYRPWRKTQIQEYDPYDYYDRVVPNEDYLHSRDYLARDTKYNATGIKPIHTPRTNPGEPYREYGFSYTSNLPYKYSVQQAQQRYPLFKREHIHLGLPKQEADHYDEVYNVSVLNGAW